ncbi:MAG: hypothetical protein WA843_02530 [Candidatus Saccharimonadales bacterium]
MIHIMKDKYQEVPGRREGQIPVLVRRNVTNTWGEADADLDNVTNLINEAGSSEKIRKIKLHSGRLFGNGMPLGRLTLGFRNPFTKTLHSAVGVNGRPPGLPIRSDLPESIKSGLEDHHTATMSKLIRNVLQASGVRGPELHEREQELYAAHAGDIQFKQPPSAR